MRQLFSKPDAHLAACGNLAFTLTAHRIPHAPSFLRGLRALFVTDVHVTMRASEADLDAFAGRLAALRADLLLLGGDYADEAAEARRLFEHLKGLEPPLGSFAAAGNNDREAWPDIEALRAVMADAGVRLLVNESVALPLNGGILRVAGIDEYRYGAPASDALYPESPAPGLYRLLLSHYPIPPRCLPDLMLSGHTHGGQFNVLGVTPYTVGFERIFARGRMSRYIAGLHEYRGAQVLVSKGVGASRVQLRAGVRPEVNLIEF